MIDLNTSVLLFYVTNDFKYVYIMSILYKYTVHTQHKGINGIELLKGQNWQYL